jgi:hypothetical protein
VTATLSNVPAGTQAQLRFDGEVVNEGAAGSNGVLILSYTIPAGTKTGAHTLVFTGAGFQCDATAGRNFAVGVLGATFTNSSEAAGNAVSRNPLVRTGIELALYLAVALVLVLAGFVLVRLARRGRRRAVKRRNRVDRLVDR